MTRPLANPTHALRDPSGAIYALVRIPRTTYGYAVQPVNDLADMDPGTASARQHWGPSAHDDLMMAAYYAECWIRGGRVGPLPDGVYRWRGVFAFLFGPEWARFPDSCILEPYQ